jgi:hypothetical protein
MQPNLKSLRATTMNITAEILISRELVLKIRKIAIPDKDGDSVFFDSYQYHRAMATVKEVTKKTKKYVIEFGYEAQSGGRLPKYFPRIEQLIDIVSVMGEEIDFDCSLSFTFKKSSHTRSIISLPLIYFESPNMPFDRIQGVHLIKTDQKQMQYELYLDSPNPGVLVQNVFFKHLSIFDKTFPEKIFQRGEAISNSCLIKDVKDDHNTK